MKRSIALIIVALMMATTFGCGGTGGQGSTGTSTVKISIAGLNKTAAGSALSARSASIASVLFTISAPDMQTMTSTVPVTGSDTITASFEVPNGSSRHFLAAALAADGTVLSQGDQFADLNGNLTKIDIVMGVDISGDWTVTHTVQGGQHSDFITYTQTGNSLSLSGDFIGRGTIFGNDIQLSFIAVKDCADVSASGSLFSDGTAGGTFTASGTTAGGCEFIPGTYVGTWKTMRGHIIPPPPPVQQGAVSGTVTDALTGLPLDGVSVSLSLQGSMVATGTTASDGTYALTASAGSGYSAAFSKAGYITATVNDITITENATTTLNAVLSPVLSAGQVRIVLTWDYSKGSLDLDSHLKGPRAAGDTTSGPFHTWFADPTYIFAGTKYADLDIDWITPSDGPVPQETTTIYQQVSGVYTYYVHDFTNGGSTSSLALSNSSAAVTVYIGSGIAATYSVPVNQPGTVWTVFQLDGSTITPINTLSSNETVIQSASRKVSLKRKGSRLR